MDATLEKPMLTRDQEKMVEILSLLKGIQKLKDKQPETADMSKLKSEESAEQNRQSGQGLKI